MPLVETPERDVFAFHPVVPGLARDHPSLTSFAVSMDEAKFRESVRKSNADWAKVSPKRRTEVMVFASKAATQAAP